MVPLSNRFVEIDQTANYIPIASTITNLINIFLKAVIFLEQTIRNSHYFTHLDRKSFSDCLILLIPVLGNVMYFFRNVQSMEPLEEIREEAIQPDSPCDPYIDFWKDEEEEGEKFYPW